ncbi:MAG: hypothetical protein WCC65_14330 [Pseudonocardiaceae bacterium]
MTSRYQCGASSAPGPLKGAVGKIITYGVGLSRPDAPGSCALISYPDRRRVVSLPVAAGEIVLYCADAPGQFRHRGGCLHTGVPHRGGVCSERTAGGVM